MAEAAARHPPERPAFLRRWVFSTDHKVIGIQYLITGMAMGIVGGLLAMLVRLPAQPT